MRKLLSMSLVCVLLLSLFAGCASSAQPAAPAASAAPAVSSAPAASAAPAAPEAPKPVKIALSIPLASSPYWTGVAYGVQKTVDEINAKTPGAIAYQFFDPGSFELETQMKNIENALSLGIDGMVIAPVDANGTVPVIEMAYSEGMTIFTVDVSANTDVVLAGYCTFNYNAGVSNANKMAELIKEKNGDYVGKIAVNMGRANISSHIARVAGFKDTLKEKYPNLEIVFEQFIEKNEDSQNVAENALVMNPKLDGFFCTGDTVANLTCQAVDQSNRFKPIGDPDHIVIVGFDGNAEGISNIRAGRQDATIAQNPIEMGKLTLQALYTYLTEGTLPERGEKNLIEVPHFPIDYKNIDSAEAKAFMWSENVKGVDIRLG